MISGTEVDQELHNQAISPWVGGHQAAFEWNAGGDPCMGLGAEAKDSRRGRGAGRCIGTGMQERDIGRANP